MRPVWKSPQPTERIKVWISGTNAMSVLLFSCDLQICKISLIDVRGIYVISMNQNKEEPETVVTNSWKASKSKNHGKEVEVDLPSFEEGEVWGYEVGFEIRSWGTRNERTAKDDMKTKIEAGDGKAGWMMARQGAVEVLRFYPMFLWRAWKGHKVTWTWLIYI